MIVRVMMVMLIGLAVGCGPTRTPGTEGIPREQLTVLTIKQHNTFPGTHINAVKFDKGSRYEINGNRDFYLKPGDHEIAVGVGECVHGPAAWFSPLGDLAVFIPASTGKLEAGKHYELRSWTEGLQGPTEFLSRVAEEVQK